MTSGAVIRPMSFDDVAQCARIRDLSFAHLDNPGRTGRELDQIAPSPEWMRRCQHWIGTDPGGSWVAELEGRILGFATSAVREKLWIFGSFAVHPEAQGYRIGSALIAASRDYGKGCLRQILSATTDPRALRLYANFGMDFYPQMELTGVVRRSGLEHHRHVREGESRDREMAESVDRQVRGSSHGPDHDYLRGAHRFVVIDRPKEHGYAYLQGSRVRLLAATSRKAASGLLTEALATAEDQEVNVGHLTSANQWALKLGLQAGLMLATRGHLCVRHMRIPENYIHHPSML